MRCLGGFSNGVVRFSYMIDLFLRLLPRTTFFLERIYLSIIVMSLAAIVGVRVLVNSNRASRRSFIFELAFFVLVTGNKWLLLMNLAL